jgi:hypothetical protein
VVVCELYWLLLLLCCGGKGVEMRALDVELLVVDLVANSIM